MALETLPVFVWLNTDCFWLQKEVTSFTFFLHSTFLQVISAVMLTPVHVQKVSQASKHLCPARLQNRCGVCFAWKSICLLINIIIIIALKGAIWDFFTVSSLHLELSPTCTLKWPEWNRVQIICNTSSAYYVQHVMLRSTWYKGTAQPLSFTEFKWRLFDLYFIGWTILSDPSMASLCSGRLYGCDLLPYWSQNSTVSSVLGPLSCVRQCCGFKPPLSVWQRGFFP